EHRTELVVNDQKQNAITIRNILLIGSIFIIFFVSLLFIIMARAISDLPKVAEKLKQGDISTTFETKRSDEVGQLLNGIQIMSNKLRTMHGEITDATNKISNVSEHVNTESASTNDYIYNLNSKTEQVATAMNEMTTTVQEVAKSIQNSALVSEEAENKAKSGINIITRTISEIEELSHKLEKTALTIHKVEEESGAITAVLDVIKGVAEQTNLLALNAAIEAARAGEHGRGFAVVADEVRTLATATQQSTSEINDIIVKLQEQARDAVNIMGQSRQQAHIVVAHAKEADNTFAGIAQLISEINTMNNQIATAAKQQGGVSEEINRNIIIINDMSYESAASAEKTAAASVELETVVKDMGASLGKFRI
ncbi:MAG: methyl-accepting chemotaxis protein, partial [Gammaproteobacteria bacterium]|nr:methyl-accepting chemotaxis protein [Gammaproteobacteria bacterium]